MAESIFTQDGVEQDRSFVIYKHTSPSGKAYIGQTCDYERRNKGHQAANSECSSFHAAIRKYGWDAFKHEILLDGLNVAEANEAEQRMIAEHGTLSPGGYNLQTGGGNFKASEETRKKIGAAMKDRVFSDEHRARLSNAMKGRKQTREQIERAAAKRRGCPISEEHKAALLAANLGAKRSDESRARMSQAQMGNKNAAGRMMSEATKAKLAIANTGRKFTPEHRAKLSAAKLGNKNRLGGQKYIDSTITQVQKAFDF